MGRRGRSPRLAELAGGVLPAAGLGACVCCDAPAPLRADFIAEVARRTPAPRRTAARLCVVDVDAGRLAQTARQLTALGQAGWRRLHVTVTDPYYPANLCGTFRLEGGAWARTPPADDVGARLLADADAALCNAQALRALPDFLEVLGIWALHGRRDVEAAVFRSTDGYCRAVADGAVPPPTLVLGVDLELPIDVDLRRANQLSGRDGHGDFDVLLPVAGPPLVERSGPAVPVNLATAPAGGVEAALAALTPRADARAVRLARGVTVLRHAGGGLRSRDNALVRLADVAAVAAPNALLALLYRNTCLYRPATECAGPEGVIRFRAHARDRGRQEIPPPADGAMIAVGRQTDAPGTPVVLHRTVDAALRFQGL